MANHNIGDIEETALEQTPAAVPIQPLNPIYIKPQIMVVTEPIEPVGAAVPVQPLFILKKQQKTSNKPRTTTKIKPIKPRTITKILNSITIMSFNMRSWAINNTAIESYISENPPPDIWLLQETWLK